MPICHSLQESCGSHLMSRKAHSVGEESTDEGLPAEGKQLEQWGAQPWLLETHSALAEVPKVLL